MAGAFDSGAFDSGAFDVGSTDPLTITADTEVLTLVVFGATVVALTQSDDGLTFTLVSTDELISNVIADRDATSTMLEDTMTATIGGSSV